MDFRHGRYARITDDGSIEARSTSKAIGAGIKASNTKWQERLSLIRRRMECVCGVQQIPVTTLSEAVEAALLVHC